MSQTVLRARAPVRIDLAGGWTDVPPFSAEVGGAVVSGAINRYTYVTMIPHAGEQIEIESADFDRYLEVKSFRDIEYDGNLDLIKAAIHRLGIQQECTSTCAATRRRGRVPAPRRRSAWRSSGCSTGCRTTSFRCTRSRA
ncbi:MAG: hypothetical protein M5R40_07855 [Anaerolineae bacterium]|nr:hypothetical protein [Anaerolineae bacterium]